MPRCPLCGSEDAAHHLTVTAAETARWFAATTQADEAALNASLSATWERGQAEVFLCRMCEFGFAEPQVAGDSEFYSQLYGDEPEYPEDRWEFGRTLEAMSELSGGRLLEVGAGGGHFLVQASNAGGWQCSALEYSEGAIAELNRLGFEARQASIEELAEDERWGGWEVICLFQTLEHLAHPQKVVAGLASLLAPRGHLFVSVPNGKYVELQERLTGALDLPPNHLTRWSEQSLRTVADSHALETVVIETEPMSQDAIAWTLVTYHGLAHPLPGRLRRVPRVLDVRNHLRWRHIKRQGPLPGMALWAHFTKA